MVAQFDSFDELLFVNSYDQEVPIRVIVHDNDCAIWDDFEAYPSELLDNIADLAVGDYHLIGECPSKVIRRIDRYKVTGISRKLGVNYNVLLYKTGKLGANDALNNIEDILVPIRY